MAILQKILAWTQGIPLWQSDAVARILTKNNLSAEDYDDLVALLKLAHGIDDPKGRTPKPLTADQIPALVQETIHVKLKAIKNLNHVNAIANNQRIPFGETGMTVIYGDNGSGKSGYSRVLKRACRARDQEEQIYPNANLPENQIGSPSAIFEISINDVQQEVVWNQGKPAPVELSTLSIFDTRCARAYLDSEDDFSYVPYGLDIFESLVKVFQRLKLLIENEHRQLTVDTSAFNYLAGATLVGKLISTLSARTNASHIESLSVLTEEELALYQVQLKSLKENNPKEKASSNRARARRFVALAQRILTEHAWVNQHAVNKFKDLADRYRIAQSAASLAAQKFQEEDKLLPGTGGEAWKDLFEAARKFSTASCPEKQFPDLGERAPCPLCQQPLAEAADRLKRFQSFIEAEAEKTVQDRRRELFVLYKPLDEHKFSLNLDDVTLGEIEENDPKLAKEIKEFEKTLIAQGEAIKTAIKSHEWKQIVDVLETPAERLQILANALNDEAKALEQASDEKARAELQKSFDELDARVRLSQVKDAVTKAIQKLDSQAKLKRCIEALKTTPISNKAAELTQEVVSSELANALNREFTELGVGALRVSLQSRVDKGRALHKLKLELPQRRTPGDILSEGEQRAIAIGSFLAEVGLTCSKGGIVFDDPVSSLDHRRRERVAKRLAVESTQRQVIIFTHDIYFLCLLIEETKLSGAPILTQSITRRQEGYGVSHLELPFEGKSVTKRIASLREHHQIIAKLFKDGNEQEHIRHTIEAYFRLRMTWERAVEEVLLQNVVIRFRKSIETQRLSGVIVEDADYEKIYQGMSKCSNYAHDKSMTGGVAVPDPDELLADINFLEEWRSKTQARSEETAKNRKIVNLKK